MSFSTIKIEKRSEKKKTRKKYTAKKSSLKSRLEREATNKIFSKYELPQQTLVCIIFNIDNLKKNDILPIIKLNGHFLLVLKALRNIFEVFFMKLCTAS